MKEIELTKGKKALVDDDWYQVLSKFKWSHVGGAGHVLESLSEIARFLEVE